MHGSGPHKARNSTGGFCGCQCICSRRKSRLAIVRGAWLTPHMKRRAKQPKTRIKHRAQSSKSRPGCAVTAISQDMLIGALRQAGKPLSKAALVQASNLGKHAQTQ